MRRGAALLVGGFLKKEAEIAFGKIKLRGPF